MKLLDITQLTSKCDGLRIRVPNQVGEDDGVGGKEAKTYGCEEHLLIQPLNVSHLDHSKNTGRRPRSEYGTGRRLGTAWPKRAPSDLEPPGMIEQ